MHLLLVPGIYSWHVSRRAWVHRPPCSTMALRDCPDRSQTGAVALGADGSGTRAEKHRDSSDFFLRPCFELNDRISQRPTAIADIDVREVFGMPCLHLFSVGYFPAWVLLQASTQRRDLFRPGQTTTSAWRPGAHAQTSNGAQRGVPAAFVPVTLTPFASWPLGACCFVAATSV